MRKIFTLLLLFSLAIIARAEDDRYTSTSVLSSGTWVKIRVKDEGVYQLNSVDLKKMGFSNPDNVRLFGYNRPVLPETNIQNIEDDLVEIPLYHNDKTATLLFYSKGTTEWKRSSETSVDFTHKNNPYSSYVYYFLTEGGTPAAFRQVDGKTDAAPTQTTYYAHSIYEKDEFSIINCGRTFFEAYDYANGSIRAYKLDIPNHEKSDIKVTVQFAASGKSSSDKSTLKVSSDNLALGTMSFNGLADYQYAYVVNKTFTAKGKIGGSLPITLEHDRKNGTTGHLDYIQACYEAGLNAESSYVAFTPNTSGRQVFSIAGMNVDDLVLWNVTSPSSTYEITGTIKGSDTPQPDGGVKLGKSLHAEVKNSKITDLYVAVTKKANYPTPEYVGKVSNQNLHALKDINLLIIVPSSGRYNAQAQRLADAHKEYDGMNCVVVRADEVYNEFSSGTPDITAYRRLAKMLYDRDGSLQNILLFGACYWDNRLLTPGLGTKKADDLLLVYESDNSWSHIDSYPCEEYIALLDDGEGVSPLKEKPDAGVGRLPVTTVTEAQDVVNKLISYIKNEEAGAWKNTICFMGDDGNSNTHMSDAEDIIKRTKQLYPDFRYKRIYWDSYTRTQSATGNSYPDAYNDINRTMEEGALIMNYTGHGAAYCLSHEQVLKLADFSRWSSPRLPLWLTAGCDICPFDMNTENLAVNAVLNPKGAAMGMISTARTVYSTQNRVINRNFMKWVLASNEQGERYTIGEALALAKCDIVNNKSLSKIDSINKAEYVLIGDPAIRLITPEYKVKIDNISGKTDNNNVPILAAGSLVTVTGHVEDKRGNAVKTFNGIISPTVFDTEQHIICKNNEGGDYLPFEYDDRTRILYSGSDSIKSGEFSFSFYVPLDINYDENFGEMKLYAVSHDHKEEAHGTHNEFLMGAENDIPADTIGPRIAMWLNNTSFRNGDHTGISPTLYVVLTDSTGINTTGNGIGHDIEIIIDNNEATTYSLNSYFTQKAGDYTSGSIKYQIPELTPGEHSLTLRAFDVLNNPSVASIKFFVYEGEEIVETYDMSGRKFSSHHTTTLPPGVYIKRYTYKVDGKITEEKTEKFIVK